MNGIRIENLSVRRGQTAVLEQITLALEPGELVGLIGPNGAGKTTLMRAALGLLPFEGRSSLALLPERDRARMAAWLPQERDIAWPVDVETLVALGRTPYLAAGRKLSETDRSAIARAISKMGLQGLARRQANELSGGERARALIARVLAQETPVVFADEPIAGLDPAHQIAAMKVFQSLAAESKTVAVSLHDLGLASRYCDRLVLLDRGRVVADGSPDKVLTDMRMRSVFSVGGHWADTPNGPVFHPVEAVEP
ncbi:ABC transporter ATP-binding protein [Silicimonas sp. MF1-12-2]|uniref:ABC transporter ATP-binding protein n=1 Tax=Silicimonas sp. MF1-12-2 TaxID=3384793 RepID=UPI0039B664AE